MWELLRIAEGALKNSRGLGEALTHFSQAVQLGNGCWLYLFVETEVLKVFGQNETVLFQILCTIYALYEKENPHVSLLGALLCSASGPREAERICPGSTWAWPH